MEYSCNFAPKFHHLALLLMKTLVQTFVVALVLSLLSCELKAQHYVNPAAGGHGTVGAIYMEYTVGEPIVGPAWTVDRNLLLTQGFLQGFGPWSPSQGGESGEGGQGGEGGTTDPNLPNAVPVQLAAQGFSLYPNPATNEVRIELSPMPQTAVHVSCYAMNGRPALARTFGPAESLQLDLGQLPSGVYIVRISAQGFTTQTAKLVKL